MVIPLIQSDFTGYDSVVVVSDKSDFGTATNGVITLDPAKTYFIDGAIDMGSTQLGVTEGGASFYSDDLNTKGLFSTEDNYTMLIVAPNNSYSGNLTVKQLFLYCTGTASLVGNLDNAGNNAAAEFRDTNFGQFGFTSTKFIEFSDYRQYRFDGCAFINYTNGFTFNGTSSGLVAESSIVLNAAASSVLFAEGTSLIFNTSVRSDINFLSVDSTSVLMDFSATNISEDSGLRLTGVRSAADDAMPNLAGSNVKALYRFCEGIKDSYLGGEMQVTVGATTVIATAGTPVKMAGTTTDSQLAHFDNDGGTNNRIRYIGDIIRDFTVEAIGTFSGGNNDQVKMIIRHYDDSLGAFSDDVDEKLATLNGGLLGTRAENLTARGIVTLDNNDYLELWVSNETDATNITTIAGTQMTITER